MGWNQSFFGPGGGLHQVMRNGSVVYDLSTGKSGFVISDDGNMLMVTDQDGRMHQFMKNGNVTTDLSTGATYFEI